MNTTTLICNALFRVGSYKLEDAQTKLKDLQLRLLKSRKRFNDDLEEQILKQEKYINLLLTYEPKRKKHY